jgi:hypothetical protein
MCQLPDRNVQRHSRTNHLHELPDGSLQHNIPCRNVRRVLELCGWNL